MCVWQYNINTCVHAMYMHIQVHVHVCSTCVCMCSPIHVYTCDISWLSLYIHVLSVWLSDDSTLRFFFQLTVLRLYQVLFWVDPERDRLAVSMTPTSPTSSGTPPLTLTQHSTPRAFRSHLYTRARRLLPTCRMVA